MPTILQHMYKEIINQLINLETDKDEDQLIIITLIKTILCLYCHFFISNIILESLIIIQVIKQYRQSVIFSENV